MGRHGVRAMKALAVWAMGAALATTGCGRTGLDCHCDEQTPAQAGGRNASGAGGAAGAGGTPLGGAGGFVAQCGPLSPSASSIQRYSLLDLHQTARSVLGVQGLAEEFVLTEDSQPGQFRPADAAFRVEWNLRAATYVRAYQLPSPAPAVEDFVKTYGRQLYRRELTPEQVRSHVDAFEYWQPSAPPEIDSFLYAARMVLQGMLGSPYFLFRIELGEPTATNPPSSPPPYAITAYEVAARLSHFTVRRAPDLELLQSAADGSLLEPRTLEAQYERLRRSPEGRVHRTQQLLELLGVDRFQACSPLPDCTPDDLLGDFELSRDLLAQTRRFIDDLLDRPVAPLSELLTSSRQPLNARLAQHYGVAVTASPELEPVSLEPSRFAGVLTQGTVLSLFRTPSQRGAFVLGRLLGAYPPVPPLAHLFDLEAFEGQSPRERTINATRNEPCRSCHDLMDPMGFALEAFDSRGRLSGLVSNGELRLPGEAPLPVANPGELGRALAGSRALKLGMVRRYYELVTDRQLAGTDSVEQPWLECLVDRLPAGDLDLHTLARVLGTSEALRVTDRPPRQAVGVATSLSPYADRPGEEAKGLMNGLPPGDDRERLEQFIGP